MNSTAVLSLLGDLYVQIEALQKENEGLKRRAAEANMDAIRPKPDRPEFDPLGGPEEAVAQARKESESQDGLPS